MKLLNIFLPMLFATPLTFSSGYYFLGKERDLKNWSYLNSFLTLMVTLIFLGLFFATPLFPQWSVKLLSLFSLDFFWKGEINRTSSVVLILCLCLNLFSKLLLRGDASFGILSRMRFFFYADLFLFALFVSISANSFLPLFWGWELLGISSYLLLNFSYENRFSNHASFTSFLYDQVGLAVLLLGGSWLVFFYGDVNFSDAEWSLIKQTPVGICFLVSIVCRLLQFGVNTWISQSKEVSSNFLSFSGSFMLGIPAFFLLWRLDLLEVPFFKLVSLGLGILTFIFGLLGAFLKPLLKEKGMHLTVAYWGGILIFSTFGFYKFSFACVLALSVAQFVFLNVEESLSLKGNGSFYNWEPNPYMVWVAGLMVFWGILHTFVLCGMTSLIGSFKGWVPWALNGGIFALSVAVWRPAFLLCSVAFDRKRYVVDTSEDKIWTVFFLSFSFIFLVVAFFCFWLFLRGDIRHNASIPWVKTSVFLGSAIALSCGHVFLCKGTQAMVERAVEGRWQMILEQVYLEKLHDLILVKPFKWISVSISEKIDGFLIEEQAFEGIILFLKRLHQLVERVQAQTLSFYSLCILLGALGGLFFFMFKAQ